MPFIEAPWRIHLLGENPTWDEENCVAWRRALGLSWHVVAWIPVWRIGDGSGTPGALTIWEFVEVCDGGMWTLEGSVSLVLAYKFPL
jgi:hypothetical protein